MGRPSELDLTRRSLHRLTQDRMSLSLTLPAAACGLALLLTIIFVVVSVAGTSYRTQTESEARTGELAEAIAPAVARGDFAAVARLLDSLAADRAVYVDAQGAVRAGRLNVDEGWSAEATIPGGPGHVVTRGLSPFRLNTPDWLIVILAGLSMALSGLLAAFYSQRVLTGLRRLEHSLEPSEIAESARDRRPTFTELHRAALKVQRTVAALRRDRAHLIRSAYEHPQSGLPNLRALTSAMERDLRVVDFHSPVCLMVIELDRFERANEMFGNDVAQLMTQKAVERIRDELRELRRSQRADTQEYLLAHLQSDGFGLLLPRLGSRQDAATIVRGLRRAFVNPLDVDGRHVSLGISGGIVVAPEDGDTPDDLLRRARIALRSLRDDGQEGFKFYTPRLDRVAKGRIALESELREGIDRHEFRPFFQAKVDLRTGRVAGCEALARWQRGERRAVAPSAFIPVAEETGLIDAIGQQILDQACETAASWHRAGHGLPVAVNVSPGQLEGAGFRDQVLEALTRSGLPPHLLELEITESMAVNDPRHVEEVLHPLKAMGVRLAVDDFGTGHSNLSIITRLNFDVFKIDRQFIAGLQRDASAPTIVEMILAMAESLGLDTVAEGVETNEQAEFLRQRGCTLAQGFLFSRPLPAEPFGQFIRTWNDHGSLPAALRAG